MADKQSAKDKMAERMAKLKALHDARNNARSQNHVEVKKELERDHLPKNWEIRKQKADWLIKDKANREAIEEKGLDYDRVKLLNVSALDQDRIERMKKKRKVGDQGFADYETQTARQYQRLIKQMPPKNIQLYNAQKESYGEEYYSSNPILEGKAKDSKEAVKRMVDDLEEQANKRKNFSRRRMHNDEADIDYINEKNARLNKKLDRYYGEYTKEIKQNLERGTAI
jgi:pre-mRNA-splicing factor SYF2